MLSNDPISLMPAETYLNAANVDAYEQALGILLVRRNGGKKCLDKYNGFERFDGVAGT